MSNKSLSELMKEWRQYLHAHPETAFEEENTSKYVTDILTDLGLEVRKGIGKTGVVAVLKAGDGKKLIGLRADMDAINLTETTNLPYRSKHDGKMHACGHDGHTATLLGAAKLLSQRKNFNGTVVFVFQPAEEPGKGAQAMIDDGLFQRFPMDEIYGLHCMPALPAGTIHTRAGPFFASEDNFVIRIKGIGGHASAPHNGVDPFISAAQIIMALQTIVSRNLNPLASAVISCTELHTDGARNAIPTIVTIKGDTRSYMPEVQQLIEKRMRSVCENISQANGAECQFEYTHEFAPTVNWECCVNAAEEAARAVVGEKNVNANAEPIMGSEDFGLFTQKIPGCLIFLGSAKKDNIPLHNSLFDYNDDILETGAEFFAELIKNRLPKS